MDDDSPTCSEPPSRSGRGASKGRRGPASVELSFSAPAARLADAVARWVADRAGEAIAALGAAGEVRVRVVTDTEMAAAHERYSGVAGTTDVLTFDLGDPPAQGAAGGLRVLDTDLLVCVDEARRQAAAHGHAVERELLLYILHGVLHCLGYDDHTEEGSAEMHRKEDEVLTAIGVGATYAPAAPEPAGRRSP